MGLLVERRERLLAKQRGGEQLVPGREVDPLLREAQDDAAVDDEPGHAGTLTHAVTRSEAREYPDAERDDLSDGKWRRA